MCLSAVDGSSFLSGFAMEESQYIFDFITEIESGDHYPIDIPYSDTLEIIKSAEQLQSAYALIGIRMGSGNKASIL